MTVNPTDAVDQAIRSVGGVANLGSTLGVSHSAVVRWRQAGRVPVKHILHIERATGVPRHRLRPDLYPEPVAGFSEAQAPLCQAAPDHAAEARTLGLDPDAIAAKAVAEAVRAEKTRRWQEENRAAMDAWNEWTERNGLPLAKYRMF